MDNNQNSKNKTMLEFLSLKFKTNDPKEIQKCLNSLDELKQKELATEYKLWKVNREKQKMKKAAHGAKLDYVKSLKHICPEGLELYYYKVGGSINCGCKGKKFEKGDKVEKAETGTVAKFKAIKKGKTGYKNDDKQDSAKKARSIVTFASTVTGQQAGFNRAAKEKDQQNNKQQNHQKPEVKEGWDEHGNYIVTKKGIKERESQLKSNKTLEETTPPKINKGIHKNACGSKIKKDCGGAVAKFKAARCGAKMKKHKLGGSLNRIPFMQKGTPKEGLPTAPKAENRFRKNSLNTTKEGNRETTTITSQTFGYNRSWPFFRQPATILRIIEGGDTAFVETPEHHIFTKVLPRTALKSGNVYVEYNPKYDKTYSLHGQANTVFNHPVTSLEYEILKRRFNAAWNLAK